MELAFQNIRIREADEADAALLCKWWNDGKIMAHAGFPLGIGTTEDEIIRKIRAETDDTTRRHMILIDHVPVGEMNYHQLNDNTCEMGIKICESDYQNRGYGTIILHMFIHGLFHIRNYDTVVLDTNLNNLRAQHVYEKTGFTKVHIHYNSWKDQLGQLQSSVVYALRQEDYHCPYVFDA